MLPFSLGFPRHRKTQQGGVRSGSPPMDGEHYMRIMQMVMLKECQMIKLTFASSSPQVPSRSLAKRWRAATTSSPSPSLTLTASRANERARLPGSNSIVLYPLSGDPDDRVGDGEESLVVLLTPRSLPMHVPSSADEKSASILGGVVSLCRWKSLDDSLTCEESFTCGCSFSLEDSLQNMTFLLPWPDVPLSCEKLI